jgi:hypothetical protein
MNLVGCGGSIREASGIIHDHDRADPFGGDSDLHALPPVAARLEERLGHETGARTSTRVYSFKRRKP